jgi:hypothetical protein
MTGRLATSRVPARDRELGSFEQMVRERPLARPPLVVPPLHVLAARRRQAVDAAGPGETEPGASTNGAAHHFTGRIPR